jgi:salicylate hydroxylase
MEMMWTPQSELKTWTKDSGALLGDACHPTLPYQAQGAAMAVEEGAALGILVGSLSQSRLEDRKAHVPETLQLYEAMRKRNKELLDADLTDINKNCRWGYANLRYQKQLMGFDTIKDAREQFQKWIRAIQ